MTANTGFPADQCISLPLQSGAIAFGKVSCKDNKLSAVGCTDNTCSSCSGAELPTDCLQGIKIACGVGSASGVVVSFAVLALGAIVSMIALF
jgi:hypothetical protein